MTYVLMETRVPLVRLVSVLVLAAALMSLGPTPASACSCMPFDTVVGQVARADVVFVGRLIGSEGLGIRLSPMDPVAYRFDVERVMKGAVPRNAKVHTLADGAMCGLGQRLEPGERYTVFARLDGADLRSGLCDGTAPGDPDPLVAGLRGTLLPAEPEPPPPWVFGAVILAAALAVWGRRVSVRTG